MWYEALGYCILTEAPTPVKMISLASAFDRLQKTDEDVFVSFDLPNKGPRMGQDQQTLTLKLAP